MEKKFSKPKIKIKLSLVFWIKVKRNETDKKLVTQKLTFKTCNFGLIDKAVLEILRLWMFLGKLDFSVLVESESFQEFLVICKWGFRIFCEIIDFLKNNLPL